MKTVSGEVISSKSISLKNAAKTLSKFASSDNGASPAFAAYLRRASASFNELVELHKESKSSGSEHKVKKRPSKDVSEGTYESAINSAVKGLVKDRDVNKRKDSRGVNKDEGETRGSDVRTEVQKFEGFVDGNGLKSETESFNGSQDTQKKKRDKLGTEKHYVSVDIEKKIASFATIDTGKKHDNKQKKNREQSYSDPAAIIAKNQIESIDQSKETKKKKKNMQKSDDDRQSTETVKNYGDKKKGQPSGDHSTYSANASNGLDSFDGNKEKKKKKKSDDHGNIKSGEVIVKEKEMHSDPSVQDGLNNEATRVMDNSGDGKKKRKKNKNKNEMNEERFNSDINGDQQRNESNDIHGVNNKESRKRKHESLVVGGVDVLQEQHNLKKKKR